MSPEGQPKPTAAPSPFILNRKRRWLASLLPDVTQYDFMAAAIEIVNRPASPIGRTISWLIMAACTSALIWSAIGKVDVVVTARGKVIPASYSKVVQAPEAAQVAAIHVENGQHVEAGQVLIELNPTEASADREKMAHDLAETRLTALSLQAIMSAPEDPALALEHFTPPAGTPTEILTRHSSQIVSATSEQQSKLNALAAQMRQREAEATTARAQLTQINVQLPLVREQLAAKQQLVTSGILARMALLQFEQSYAELDKSVDVQQSRIKEAEAARDQLIDSIKQAKAEFSRTTLSQLADTEEKAAELEQELIKAEHRHQRLSLTAPVSGDVQQLAVHTLGGVVTPAQNLLTIVPEGSKLEIEARILNNDIGLVAPQQRASIKVDAFDFTKFGLAEGIIVNVSRDAVPAQQADTDNPAAAQQTPEPVYVARILLDKPYLGDTPSRLTIVPGMGVSAEVKTDRRRVLDYLLSPIIEHAHDSLREQ